MWRRWFDLQVWNIWNLLFGLCVTTVALAWSSFNLYGLAAANIRLLTEYGVMAIMDGGLLQLLEIVAYGLLSLALYLAFRGFDTEIIERWREISKK